MLDLKILFFIILIIKLTSCNYADNKWRVENVTMVLFGTNDSIIMSSHFDNTVLEVNMVESFDEKYKNYGILIFYEKEFYSDSTRYSKLNYNPGIDGTNMALEEIYAPNEDCYFSTNKLSKNNKVSSVWVKILNYKNENNDDLTFLAFQSLKEYDNYCSGKANTEPALIWLDYKNECDSTIYLKFKYNEKEIIVRNGYKGD